MQVETPLGRDVLPNPRVVERAEKEDLDKPLTYQVGAVPGGRACGAGACTGAVSYWACFCMCVNGTYGELPVQLCT